jgi:superfamily I DNA/RNA helicase
VLLGENDEALPPVARERLAAFRAARRRWLEEERRLDVPTLAAYVFAETVLAGGGSDARARLRRGLVERLLAGLEGYAAANPRATLHDALLHAERLARGDDDLLRVRAHDPDAVAVLGVEAAKGREFAHVFVVGVHAGAFPRYYVPDVFLYSQKYGMLPKENAGADAGAARSAKFTYFQYKLELQKRYYEEERRALYCAASRARERFTLSAWGRATRGVTAPEFVEELRGTFAADDAGG